MGGGRNHPPKLVVVGGGELAVAQASPHGGLRPEALSCASSRPNLAPGLGVVVVRGPGTSLQIREILILGAPLARVSPDPLGHPIVLSAVEPQAGC